MHEKDSNKKAKLISFVVKLHSTNDMLKEYLTLAEGNLLKYDNAGVACDIHVVGVSYVNSRDTIKVPMLHIETIYRIRNKK